jgi:hypothetical protein
MEDTQSSHKRRIVQQLDFDADTARRVGWEQFEFAIAGTHRIRVTNASYGFQKEDHSYVVEVDSDGIPVSCSCPGYEHNYGPNGKAGKHMLAVATIGGPAVLNAAAKSDANPGTFPESNAGVLSNSSPQLETDGGLNLSEEEADTCPNDEKGCDGPDGDDLPCFACYQQVGR